MTDKWAPRNYRQMGASQLQIPARHCSYQEEWLLGLAEGLRLSNRGYGQLSASMAVNVPPPAEVGASSI